MVFPPYIEQKVTLKIYKKHLKVQLAILLKNKLSQDASAEFTVGLC